MQRKHLSSIVQCVGALTFCVGVALYSERLAILCGGVILTLFGIALERDA